VYLGIDLGTSSVKAVIVDENQAVVASASSPLRVDRPAPTWSEQNPEAWWQATVAAVGTLKQEHGKALAAVRGIGLSGQMHGATLLDAADKPLRPAILWNDGRSEAQCAALEQVPEFRKVAGNLVMPGFTAPKLKWVAEHEPEVFRKVAKVLLPKDYLRLRLTGEYVSEPSDAAGTLWLDVAQRTWSPALLEATGLGLEHMPSLVEGSAPSGHITRAIAAELGLPEGIVVAGGAGDNAAGAIGIGVLDPGQGFLSLGTSGVEFVALDRYAAAPERGVHSFCHCVPGRWHQMSVILSAASCLSWVTALTGSRNEAELLERVAKDTQGPGSVLFLPYLSGERTPHNDPHAKGVFFGLDHDTTPAVLARAVLEGVAMAFCDGQDALRAAGSAPESLSVIGGGARSELWGEILASALGLPLHYRSGGEVGPAFGAARLGRLAHTQEPVDAVCTEPSLIRTVEPRAAWVDAYAQRLERFRTLYRELRGKL